MSSVTSATIERTITTKPVATKPVTKLIGMLAQTLPGGRKTMQISEAE